MEEAAVQAYLKSYVKATTPESPDDGVLLRNGHQAERTIFPDDVEAEVFDWILSHLESRQCPLLLATLLAKSVSQKLSSSLKLGGENSLDWNTLQTDALDTLQALCTTWMEQPQLVPLGLAPVPFPVSANAVRNSRRRMEDRHIALPYFNYAVGLQDAPGHSYYAVFDGHAGVEAAAYATAHLHYNIARHPDFLRDPKIAIREGFATTERNFLQRSSKEGMKSGCTAVCCLLRKESAGTKLYTGWLGDSQAVLVRRGRVLPLVEPHKPDREDERKRIEELGGAVVMMGTWRVNGALAVSRALGDAEHKPYVSSEPDVSSTDLDGSEDFLVIGCDGLWDQLDFDDVAAHVYGYVAQNTGEVHDVAHSLVQKARDCGSTDNITALVVFLRDPEEFTMNIAVSAQDLQMVVDDSASASLAIDQDELRHAANEVVRDTIETALHRVGYSEGYIRENGEMQTAQNIVEQVHQLHSGVCEQFRGAVPIEDSFGEDGNVWIENRGLESSRFEFQSSDLIQDQYVTQNGSGRQCGYIGTDAASGFCPVNPFGVPELATSTYPEDVKQQIAEHQPSEEPQSFRVPKDPLDEFVKLERTDSQGASGHEEREPFLADSEGFPSFIENPKHTPVQDIQHDEGLLTDDAKSDMELNITSCHEQGEAIQLEQSFGIQDLQGLPASSVDTEHHEDIPENQQFDRMSEDVISVELGESVAQPLSEAVQGDAVLGDVALHHPIQPTGEDVFHGVPEDGKATGYQEDYNADSVDDAAETVLPPVSGDSVVGTAEEPQTSAVIFCELKEPMSAPVGDGECHLTSDLQTSEKEMVRRDGDLVSQLPPEPDFCPQGFTEFHKDASHLHEDVPEFHQDVPEFHENTTEFQQDMSQLHIFQQDALQFQENATEFQQDAPQFQENATEFQQDAPQFQENATEFQRDAPQFQESATELQQDASHFQEEARDFQQDASHFQEEARDFQQDAPHFQEEATELQQHAAQFQENATELQQDVAQFQENATDLQQDAAQFQESTREFHRKETVPWNADDQQQCLLQSNMSKTFSVTSESYGVYEPVAHSMEPAKELSQGHPSQPPLETCCTGDISEPPLKTDDGLAMLTEENLLSEAPEQKLHGQGVIEPEILMSESMESGSTATLIPPDLVVPELSEPESLKAVGIEEQFLMSGTPAIVEREPDAAKPAEAEAVEPEPIHCEPVVAAHAEPESAPVQQEIVTIPAEPEAAVLQPEPVGVVSAESESAHSEHGMQPGDIVDHECAEAVVSELLAVAEAEEHKQKTEQKTEVNLPTTAEGENLKPTALEDTIAPVDLGAIPEGVPEAEGVTEDSDSEKDGGWKYVKPAAAVVATADVVVTKGATSQPKASPLAKSSPLSQKGTGPSTKTSVAKASPSAGKPSTDKAAAKVAPAKAAPKPASRSPLSPATSRPVGTSKKPMETSAKTTSAPPRKPVPATARPAPTLAKTSDKPAAKPRPAASATLPAKTKEVAKPSTSPRPTSTKINTKTTTASSSVTSTKATTSTLSTKTTTSTLTTAVKTSTTVRQTASTTRALPRTAAPPSKKPPEAAGTTKPLTRTTASAKLNKDSANQQLSTAKKPDSAASRVASARMAASASQKAAAASRTLKQNPAKTSKPTAAKMTEGAATAIKPKKIQVQQNGICEEKGSLEQMENKTAATEVPLSNGTADKSALEDGASNV